MCDIHCHISMYTSSDLDKFLIWDCLNKEQLVESLRLVARVRQHTYFALGVSGCAGSLSVCLFLVLCSQSVSGSEVRARGSSTCMLGLLITTVELGRWSKPCLPPRSC